MEELREWLVKLDRNDYNSYRMKMVKWISLVNRDDGSLVHANYNDYVYDGVVYASICNLLYMVYYDEFVENYVYGSILTYEQMITFRLEDDPNMELYDDIIIDKNRCGEVVYTHIGQMGFAKLMNYPGASDDVYYQPNRIVGELLVVPPFRHVDMAKEDEVFDFNFELEEETVVEVLLDDRVQGDVKVVMEEGDATMIVCNNDKKLVRDVTSLVGFGRLTLEPGHSRICIYYPKILAMNDCPYDEYTKRFFRGFFAQVKKMMRLSMRRSKYEKDALYNFERMMAYVRFPDNMISYDMYLELRGYLRNELRYDWSLLYSSFLVSWRSDRDVFYIDSVRSRSVFSKVHYTHPVDYEYHLLSCCQDEANAYLHRMGTEYKKISAEEREN